MTAPPFLSWDPPPRRAPGPPGRHLLAGVGPFEVRVDGFGEGGGDGQGVLSPHGERAGAPRGACNRAKPPLAGAGGAPRSEPSPTRGFGGRYFKKKKKKSPRLWMKR